VLRSVEVSGKNLEEALERAARYFDVPLESLNYEVVSEGHGFLSIFTPRVVKVRVWIGEVSEETVPAPTPAPASVSPLQAREELEKFFQQLIDKMGVEVSFQIRDKDGSLFLLVEGKDAGVLIGKKGETIEALETLLRVIMSKKGFANVGVQVDVSGYREKREEALKGLAERSARKVIKEKRRLKLEPMNARERRIIHTSLKDHPQVTTYSVGEGRGRRVVVDLKKEEKGKQAQGREKKTR